MYIYIYIYIYNLLTTKKQNKQEKHIELKMYRAKHPM